MVRQDGLQNRDRKEHASLTRLRPTASTLLTLMSLSLPLQPASATHHLQLPPLHHVARQDSELPLTVTNNCEEVIYPAILTQGGTGPKQSGFRLGPGDSVPQNVSASWRGRVWGRTNCTFDEDGNVPSSSQGGTACSTGDCGAFVECPGAGQPATLAEFTYSSSYTQSYYDLSLVDGYNLPMGIIFLPGNDANLSDIPPNLTNPICIGTTSYLTDPGPDAVNTLFGTNNTYPIPLESSLSMDSVSKWCPWPLQIDPPYRPGDGVYPYPDDNIQRPIFDPCLSACAKWNEDQYCCAGKYADPSKCRPSYYSTQAKKVCPDAYSYAYDDQTSTFVVPQGGGFEVVFCPKGRSSNILSVFGDQMREVAQTGMVSQQIERLASNETYIKLKNDGAMLDSQTSLVALVVLLVWMCLY